MKARPVLGLTMGDPAGIGPEICLRALREPSVLAECVPVLFGDANVVKQILAALTSSPKAESQFKQVANQEHSWEFVSLAEWETLTEIKEPLIVDCAAMDAAHDFASQCPRPRECPSR